MAERRADSLQVRGRLAATALFGGLDDATLDALAAALDLVRISGGERLFAQGDAGDAAYLVLGGRLRIERTRGARTEMIREVGRGELVGELSLLTGAPRSAAIRAVRDSELGRMPRDRFEALLAAHPPLALEITRMLAGQLAAPAAIPEGGAGVGTIAVRPRGWDAPARAVAEALLAALSGYGDATLVSSVTVDAALGAGAAHAPHGDPRHAATIQWLDRLEADHAEVIYLADAETSAWTERCLRQADLILDVVHGDTAPDPAEAPPAGERWTAVDLVLVHGAGVTRPAGTTRWLAGRRYQRRHHVRLGDLAGFARLARRVTGRGIGVALSGGGARGMAHLGFLRAMEELGIPVDEIGGTSAGSVIAAQYAAGMQLPEMVELNRHGWNGYKPHKAYTLPFISLVTHRAAAGMLRHMFGDLDFADCWLEAFAVSASLTHSAMRVHRGGRVAEGCLASVAIPGVAPPIVSADGELLVDGGVVNNLPAALLARGAQGAILASDVSPSEEARSGYPETPSTWQVMRDRFFRRGRAPAYPTLFETLSRVAVLGSTQETRRVRETADLYVHPPVESIGIFEFERVDEIVALGYHAALESLGPWWAARNAPRRPGRRSTMIKV